MDFVFDQQYGLHLCLVKPVLVCPVCGKEAVLKERRITREGDYLTWECPLHPQAQLVQQHHMAPDLVALDPRKTYNWGVSNQHGDTKAEFWEKNYEQNRHLVTKQSVWDLPQSDAVYLVGSGPSLKEQAGLFDGIREGTVITLNDAQRFVRGDYFFSVDFLFRDLEPDMVRDTTAIFPPLVEPRLAALPWKDVRWIRSGARHPIADRIGAAHPELYPYYEGLNGTYAAMQIIAKVLKPKLIVLVGIDAAFSGGEAHAGKAAKFDDSLKVVPGPAGDPWITSDILLAQRDYLMAQLMFLTLAGVHVWNASEGIVPEEVHIRVAPRIALKDAIAKINGQKQEG